MQTLFGLVTHSVRGGGMRDEPKERNIDEPENSAISEKILNLASMLFLKFFIVLISKVLI